MKIKKTLKLIGGLCAGAGVGLCAGVAKDNILVGLLIGLGIGLGYAVVFGAFKKN